MNIKTEEYIRLMILILFEQNLPLRGSKTICFLNNIIHNARQENNHLSKSNLILKKLFNLFFSLLL